MVAFAEAWRRDARFVVGRILGRRPPPLIRGETRSLRAPTHAPSPATPLRVARVVRETATAFSLVLTKGDQQAFAFRAGQFFTVVADGVTRNYSASNAPGGSELHFTIREKTTGRVSPRLARLTAGDTVHVLGPFGAFAWDDDGASRPVVLVAGGAGISPIMGMLRTILAKRADLDVTLLYANRSPDDVIFHAALTELATEHPRLSVVHHHGDLDRARAAAILSRIGNYREPRFFVCGPDGMRDEVLAALSELAVPESSISIERFAIGPRPHAAPTPAAPAGARALEIRVGARVHRTTALPGATLLEAGLAAGANMPFSCAAGGCGACRVKVTRGDVDLPEPHCLTPREREGGYVLACIGRPLGPCSIEVA